MRGLAGSTALVTGGGSGLGAACAVRLAAEGVTVAVTDLNAGAAAAVAADITARGGRALAIGCDVTREDDVAAFYGGLPGLWASIQVAGGFAMAPFGDTGLGDYERLMAMNATTAFLCCREAVRRIRQSPADGGRLVNVAARPALEPRTGAAMVAYTMSKSAVAALTVSLAEELAAERIWVNAVAPSILDTPANRSAMPDAPHDTWPKLDDVAATIVFLASPENRSSRGGVVPVYGGA